jgi:hypothetical protein
LILYIFIFWIANRETKGSTLNESKNSLNSICS